MNTNILTSNSIFYLNITDTTSIRKLRLINKSDSDFWFNTHGSEISKSFRFVVPVFTGYEDENVYINIDQKVQKTSKIIPMFYYARSLKKIVSTIFSIQSKVFTNTQYLKHYKDFLNNSYLLQQTILNLDNEMNMFLDLASSKNFLIKKYPLKTLFEDYYRSNNTTINSIIMKECSNHNRKQTTNFYRQ